MSVRRNRQQKREDVENVEHDQEESGDELEDSEDDVSLEIDTNSLMSRADILAALHGKGCIVMQCLPPVVKRRVKALKRLQLQTTNIEAKFFDDVHKLECKYHQLYTPYYEKRELIVSGLYNPTDEECDFPSDEEDAGGKETNEGKPGRAQESTVPTLKQAADDHIIGIPEFWLTIFKNVAMLSDMVQTHDEPILKNLIDIKVIFLTADPMGFVLEFHFAPNEYFSNAILTKEYEMKCKPDPSDPFSFEGPEIYKCKGTVIDWYKGKNVTVKTIKKKQKHKSKGAVRIVTKTIQNDSFFNFFSPPYVSDDQDADLDEDTQALLTSDFEIGHYIRERIVPRAILYYTGEALEDEEYDDEEVEADEEEEDEVEEETAGDNESNKQKPSIGRKAPKTNHSSDCKQQ